MKQFERKRTLFGADITAQVTMLDDGIHVLLTGGERSHVGAVALAWGGELAGCLSFPRHKEQVVCERWAQTLSKSLDCCVTVACGIHYEDADQNQIKAILNCTDELLNEALAVLGRYKEERT